MVPLSISTPQEIKRLGPMGSSTFCWCLHASQQAHTLLHSSFSWIAAHILAQSRHPAQILGHVLGLTVLTLSTLPLPDTPAGPGFCPSMTQGWIVLLLSYCNLNTATI